MIFSHGALIGGLGIDNLSSIDVLKEYDLSAQANYDRDFILAGTSAETGFISPEGYRLYQNYPNPFNALCYFPYRT